MEGKDDIKIIFNYKIYHIPFQSCSDINPYIYNSIQSKGRYEVKSDINEKTFQSFLNYLINKEIPLLDNNNISEFHQLSEEFDTMKDIIYIYIKYTNNSTISSLLIKNNELRDKKKQQDKILRQKVEKYGQIIHLLFKNSGINSQSSFYQLCQKLRKACLKENVKLVDLLTRKKVQQNGLLYVLNEKEGTAGVFRNLTDKNEVIIPRSIEYESKEFIVTTIHENSFKNSNKIESIDFPQDSNLSIIEEYAFLNSSLKKISIPASVVQITEGWCGRLSKLQVNLDVKNPNYINFEYRFILGKLIQKVTFLMF